MTGVTEVHDELRPLLFSIAYRMVGSVSEAEDLVQEAFLRYHRAGAEEGVEVESPKAYLSTVTTRLAIDHLRSARVRRETYVGPWLPEPLLADPAPGPGERAELDDSLSMAFLALLERLTPVERAAFLLRDVFDYAYEEIARVLERSEDNCRQLVARARKHVDAERPRFEPSRERHEALTERFLQAAQDGDVDALLALLAEDAVAYTDGGGKARAAPRPLVGAREVSRFLAAIGSRVPEGTTTRSADVNGQPGRVFADAGGTIFSVLVLDVAEGKVHGVRIASNPDKLAHLS